MPLRKKHVRRTVLACLMAGVLGVAAALVVYGMTTRGAAYDRAIAAELESRLRCKATVTGARETGPGKAAADSVELEWRTGEGLIFFCFEDLAATRNKLSGWNHLTARRGLLVISSTDLEKCLATWNQRLVQTSLEKTDWSLDCRDFTVAVRSDLAAVDKVKGRLLFLPTCVTFFDTVSEAPVDSDISIVLAADIDPMCPAGVLQHGRVLLKNRTLACLMPRFREKSGASESDETGGFEIEWQRKGWEPPEGRAKPHNPDTIVVKADNVDIAAWTAWIPGGPVQGKASVHMGCSWHDRESPNNWGIRISAAHGEISRETLKWLEGLPAGLKAVAATPGESGKLRFDRLQVNCEVLDGRGSFRGSIEGPAGIPLVTARFFGFDVPILAASPKPFDAAAVWAVVGPAMGIEKK